MLFPVLLSAKVAPGSSDYQTQLRGAFLDLNETSDGDTPRLCAWGRKGKHKASAQPATALLDALACGILRKGQLDKWRMSADSRGGYQEASDSVPISVSRFLFPFPSLQPASRRELRTPGETVGTAGQGKGKPCRINSKTLCWRAGQDKKDAHYLG